MSATASPDHDLVFPPTSVPMGFTNSDLSDFDGSPEPVIRELLQNSVDAADKAGRDRCEVRFILRDVPAEQLPGWESYWRKFDAAKQYRNARDTDPTPDERTIIQRIEDKADDQHIPLLVCLDNGTGLNPKRMDALLTAGNSDKGSGGAGSFGLGHLTAFTASSLRYVLYAGRYRNHENAMMQIASGHAILATHLATDAEGEKSHREAHGYLIVPGQQRMLFGDDQHSYLDNPPQLLREFLDLVPDTGAAVCITGFNDFLHDADDPAVAEVIATVSAANFADAIHRDRLVVTIEQTDFEGALKVLRTVDKDSLGSVLALIKGEKGGPAGQLRGWHAHRSWRTLTLGTHVVENADGKSIPEGVDVIWRHQEGTEARRSQVFLFRKGMWISTGTPRSLLEGDFSRCPKFDAVVSLTEGELETLVRSTEGPQHRDLQTKRLATSADRRRLKVLFREVGDAVRNAVGERQLEEEFTPLDFLAFRGDAAVELTPVGPKRRKVTQKGESPPTPTDRKRKRRQGDPNKPRRRAPRSGTPVEFASTLSASNGSSTVLADVAVSGGANPKFVGVRLTAVGGSDETCAMPLPPTFLTVKSISRHGDTSSATTTAGQDGEVVLEAPDGVERWQIELREPIDDPLSIELDLVRRTAPASEGEAE